MMSISELCSLNGGFYRFGGLYEFVVIYDVVIRFHMLLVFSNPESVINDRNYEQLVQDVEILTFQVGLNNFNLFTRIIHWFKLFK